MLRPFVISMMLTTPGWAEDRALIIGIEGYPNLDLRLAPQSAVDDAVAMAQLAVERWGYAQRQTSLLLDSAATSEAILNALIDELVGLTAPGDRALLYFAGVGSRNTAGERVILAYDSESLLGRIPEDAMSDILDLIQDREVTVIVDAGFRGDIDTPGQRGIGAPGFEAAPFAANGELRATYAASAVSQTAWETAAGGVFTRSFVAGASGEADADTDGVVNHGELVAYLRSETTKWCETHPDCAPQGLLPDYAGPVQSSPSMAAFTAASAPALPVPPRPDILPNPADLTIGIDGGNALRVGQSVTFRANATAAGTLVLIDLSPDGKQTQIFPSRLAPNTRMQPGQEITVPAGISSNGAPLRVRVTGPGGSGLLVGLLVPGDKPDLARALPQYLGGDKAAYLAEVAATMNALAQQANSTWSASTLAYTISE